MDPKSHNIDDHPAHWKATLLGEDFWRDAEEWNKDTNDSIEADENKSLHTRFPFNIGVEQTPPRAPAINTPIAEEALNTDASSAGLETITEKRGRRFSMSDLSINSLPSRSSISSFAPTRVLELSRRSRSRTRSSNPPPARSCSVTSNIRRSNSLLRSTLNMMSGKRKDKENAKEEVEPAIPTFTPDQATPANPLMEFRGGPVWDALPKDRRTLGIDVFWSVPTEEDVQENEHKHQHSEIVKGKGKEKVKDTLPMFPIDDMFPLCMFRNLRVLKVTGMMQSYQKYIWQAAWLNTNLEELEMGMALPPQLRRPYCTQWPYMKGGWQLDKKTTYAEPVYYGTGDGNLDPKVGIGAYLDKMCLEKSKICALAMGRTRNKLSIRTLVLTGFVIDADPFLHWFDPKRLKCINLKDNCVDAGFWLSHVMKKVTVLYPRQIEERPAVVRRVNLREELKVIEIRGGKKVGEIPYRGPQSLLQPIPRNVGAVKGVDVKKRKEEEEAGEGSQGIGISK